MNHAPSLLLICYKIERGKGSEDGSGYNIAARLAQSGYQLTLISRCNNVDLLQDDPVFQHSLLIGVDVPKPLSFIKRKGRGIIIYYYLWQLCVGLVVRDLQRRTLFDVIHQLNFHTDWAPHFLRGRGSKVVWGPISHHKWISPDFIHQGKIKAVLGEWLKLAAKHAFWRLDPLLKMAIARTDHILYADEDLAPPFRRHRNKVTFQPYAASQPEFLALPRRKPHFNVLTVGRLVPLKGFMASLEAFARFCEPLAPESVTLTIIGSGELDQRLRQRANELGLQERVRFIPWVKQSELAQFYREASVFLYPSFEAQGLVVAEAMAASVPVICLQGTGPSFLVGEAGLTVPRESFPLVVEQLTLRLQTLHGEYAHDPEAYLQRCQRTRQEYDQRLDWDVVVTNLLRLYR